MGIAFLAVNPINISGAIAIDDRDVYGWDDEEHPFNEHMEGPPKT
jgi:hypothetical protein